ncbi:MAG: hypothetical protein Q4F67_16750, partial [Propionibacteriaceae bacterium]|nr:hypothetical protein [Propionibacteriaceae bacterium]
MTDQIRTRVSRRSLAKGAAWAVPAVALTAAVPAYASSTGGAPLVGPNIDRSRGSAESADGAGQNRAFQLYVQFDNATDWPVTVDVIGYTVIGGTGASAPGTSFGIAARDDSGFTATWNDANSGDIRTVSLNYRYTVTEGPQASRTYGPYAASITKTFDQAVESSPEPTAAD